MSEPKVPSSRDLQFRAIVAVAINLVPIAGVAFWGWSAFALIFLYWLENLVIGARTLASMAANALADGAHGAGVLFYAPVFALHYGLFCLVHGMFVVAMFGHGAWGGGWGDLASTAFALFEKQPNLVFGFASIVFWQVLQFGTFITSDEVAATDQKTLMMSPYPRVVVLHLAIIFGGFVLTMLNEPLAGILVLALLKTAFDVAETMGKMPDFVAKLKEHAADYGR